MPPARRSRRFAPAGSRLTSGCRRVRPSSASAKSTTQIGRRSPPIRGSSARNVRQLRDDTLQNTEVPTVIFNDIMTMRCCEEALRMQPDAKPPIALWLNANFRREAQLPAGATDATRPENYPPGLYFAQSAGPEYCLMGLARAVDGVEAAVALGLDRSAATRPPARPAWSAASRIGCRSPRRCVSRIAWFAFAPA